MRTVDISAETPPLESLIAAAQQEDVVIKRNGHAVARLEPFNDDDLADWLFEHDPENIAKADAARAEARAGKASTLEEVKARLLTGD